jgi:hypothetical protein
MVIRFPSLAGPTALIVLGLAGGAVLLASGCSPGSPVADTGIDAPTSDTPPPPIDAPAILDTPPPMDTPAFPDGPPRDVRPDGHRDDAPARCGYSAASGTFECGGTDPWPMPPCAGFGRCCVGVCDPFGTDEVCCDPLTGRIEIYRYGAGACPLVETIDC